jgi:glycosyltransferase involved in cell wall biosynthesis
MYERAVRSNGESAGAGSIAFLFPAFPVLHQTFVLWEVLALRDSGVPIALYSLKRPSTATQQPEGAALMREVTYLPGALAPAVWRANWAALRRAPGRYAGACARVVRAWWRDRAVGAAWQGRPAGRARPEQQFTWRERLGGRFNRSPLAYLLKSLWLVPVAVYLGQELRRAGIRHVHAHWASYPATVALVLHWLFDVTFSFTAHAYDLYLVPRLLPVKVREAAFVVTCARVNATYLTQLGGPAVAPRIVVNYHGVDRDRFQPRPNAVPGDPPCIVSCGRLEPYKGHHVLLRACAQLARPVRCCIVGEGPQRARLAALADELGLGGRVEFPGAVPQTRLVELYAEADVFVLASVVSDRSGKRDVIPNVLVEAMAMGLAVVGTHVSGVSELIADGVNGRLVPPNDPLRLAAVIGELLADPAQRARLGAAAVQTVAERFDRRRNIAALVALFQGLTSCGRHLPP